VSDAPYKNYTTYAGSTKNTGLKLPSWVRNHKIALIVLVVFRRLLLSDREFIPLHETYSNLPTADLTFTSCFYQGSRLQQSTGVTSDQASLTFSEQRDKLMAAFKSRLINKLQPPQLNTRSFNGIDWI
jgi:hypothetical protein